MMEIVFTKRMDLKLRRRRVAKEKESGVTDLSGKVDETNQEEQVEIKTRTEFWKMIALVEPEKGGWRNHG